MTKAELRSLIEQEMHMFAHSRGSWRRSQMADHLATQLAPLLAEVRAEALAEGERRGGVKALSVTFDVGYDWPTPNHCRSAADALDRLTPARYGAILRAYADAEDARHNQHGPLSAAALASDRAAEGEDSEGAGL